jgi:hypothetical protein
MYLCDDTDSEEDQNEEFFDKDDDEFTQFEKSIMH